MLEGLLRTKLYVPSGRPRLVPRGRLSALLKESLTHSLTLLSAPPGFGKTTLLSEWMAQTKPRAAWLALDAGDNDPVRFWSYLIAALQQIDAETGSSGLALLQGSPVTSINAVLMALINEVDQLPGDFAIVLDDYQVIETPSIHQELSFLLEHMPRPMHLILSTRADPPLPLARLRARNQLIELHESDLRFTETEAAAFLNEAMGLALTPAQVAALEKRTEGWIAGLQLAALSLRGRDDRSSFLEAFAGSHRFVLDYLSDEVLACQPESVQSFLLQTSILERLCASLCNVVTGRADSQAVLEELERRNLFLIALDDERRWYRYHHLFADVLGHRLAEKMPATLGELHLRAGEWFEKEGLATDAVHHALAAQAWERAARLIGDTSEWLRRHGEIATLTRWIRALPEAVLSSHPGLCLTYARALSDVARFADAESVAAQVEQWLKARAAVDAADTDSLRGRVFALRAELAVTRGEFGDAIDRAQRAELLLPPDDVSWRGAAALTLARALSFTSDSPRAEEAFQRAAALGEAAEDYAKALFALCSRGEVLEAAGQLRQAVQQFGQVLQLARAWGIPNAPVTGYAMVGLGRVRYEWNELDAALIEVQAGLAYGQQAEIMDMQLRGYQALARIRQAQGDTEGALAALDQAAVVAEKMGVTQVKDWIHALRAQVWLARGDAHAAAAWANHFAGQMQEGVYPSVSIALAKIWLDQRAPDQALPLLERALESAQTVGRSGNAIHILAVQALAHQARGESAQAFAALAHALALAEPEGYVRVFADEGAPMARLLRRMLPRSSASDYIRRLLDALGGAAQIELPPAPNLRDPLSSRELEILRLITEGATNKEIADELVLTVNTVKKHISNIFGKLQVSNRAQAIARARELDLH